MTKRAAGPYAVICHKHDKVFLTKKEYIAQMDAPDSLWVCPLCGENANWDDDNYEDFYYEEERKREEQLKKLDSLANEMFKEEHDDDIAF